MILFRVHHNRQRLSTRSRSLVTPTNSILQDIDNINEIPELREGISAGDQKTSWNLSYLTFQGFHLILQFLIVILQLLYPRGPTVDALVRLPYVCGMNGQDVVLLLNVLLEVLQDGDALGHLSVETLNELVDLRL